MPETSLTIRLKKLANSGGVVRSSASTTLRSIRRTSSYCLSRSGVAIFARRESCERTQG